MASERPAIQTAFNVLHGEIKELERGHALIIKKNGTVKVSPCKDQLPRTACSFERIYFSRGTDRDIYMERKKLGKLLFPRVLKEIDGDFENTVFSFIPNTAEVAFYGFVDAIHEHLNKKKARLIKEGNGKLSTDEIELILNQNARIEKLAIKDEKLRTFIADDSSRGEMISHVYDVTYGVVKNYEDTIVVLDDSIVRGATLRDSILEILSRLKPKSIIVISSAPQIRYPDCYGIDMSRMGEFAAFQALISLIKEEGKEDILQQTYEKTKELEAKGELNSCNMLQDLYGLYTYEQISDRISMILTPEDINCDVKIIFQTIEDLHSACPNNKGDWYFSGNYPTPGGNRVVNRSFINFIENKNERAY